MLPRRQAAVRPAARHAGPADPQPQVIAAGFIAFLSGVRVKALTGCAYLPILLANNSCQDHPAGQTARTGYPQRRETALDSVPRSPNGFLSSLTADDFELIRPHIRTVDLAQEMVLVEVDETLKRAYLPHKGVISLIVKLARGEHVQVAMVGRDSIFGSFSALGDSTALNSAVVLVPGAASAIDVDQLRAAAD